MFIGRNRYNIDVLCYIVSPPQAPNFQITVRKMLILTYKGHILRNLHHFPEKMKKMTKSRKKWKKWKFWKKMNKNEKNEKNDAPDSLA